MFETFFFKLREHNIKVSLTEWLSLMNALDNGIIENFESFYYISRSMLVKHEDLFDKYDQAFVETFTNLKAVSIEELREFFEKFPLQQVEKLLNLKKGHYDYSLDELIKKFKEQMEKEDGKPHSGGDQHIGTGGTSPWGENGSADMGISFSDHHNMGTAVQIAKMRKYKNYSSDETMDIRQLQIAVARLKKLLPEGPEDELDLDKTIEESSKNGGDIEIVFRKRKKNQVKLLLLMDAGGSMDPYDRLVNLLFSALKSRIRHLKHYYFHNCIYQDVFEDMANRRAFPTTELIRKYSEENYNLIILGDAAMAPSELLNEGGSIEYWYYNRKPCIDWLQEMRNFFPSSVWINPEQPRIWSSMYTSNIISSVFPMFHLSVEGVEEAMKYLVKKQVVGYG